MRPGPSLRLLAAVALLVGAGRAADPAPAAADPAASASRAAKLCEAGDLDDAAAALRELLASLESAFGTGHSGAQIVRLNLAHVERARGREQTARELERLPPADPNAPSLDPELERALRGLRTCARARPAKKAPPAEISSEDHLKVANALYARGLYRQARENAELARETLRPDAPPAARRALRDPSRIHPGRTEEHPANRARETPRISPISRHPRRHLVYTGRSPSQEVSSMFIRSVNRDPSSASGVDRSRPRG